MVKGFQKLACRVRFDYWTFKLFVPRQRRSAVTSSFRQFGAICPQSRTRRIFAVLGFAVTAGLIVAQSQRIFLEHAMASTYFDSLAKNYTQVPIGSGNGIDTATFLEATEGLIRLFDLLGSAAFKPVQSDMSGNVKKIREKHVSNPDKYKTLQEIVLDEKSAKKKTATEGLLWLKRGLEFCAKALRRSCDNSTEELTESFTQAYETTLKQFHGVLVRPIFTVAMKACPYRKDFYAKLGADQAKVTQQLNEWLTALEKIIDILVKFYKEGGHE